MWQAAKEDFNGTRVCSILLEEEVLQESFSEPLAHTRNEVKSLYPIFRVTFQNSPVLSAALLFRKMSK